MKDTLSIVNTTLDSILRLLEDDNYTGSARVSTDFITYSVLADYPDGVFVGETLESIFSQIAPITETSNIDEEEKSKIRNVILELIMKIKKHADFSDKVSLYGYLRDLRTFVTKKQFELTASKKTRPETYASISRRRV